MIKKKPKLSRDELNEQSKQLKRKRKHKGLPSGSRLQNAEQSTTKQPKTAQDPRIGSKKPIPLTVNAKPKAQPKKIDVVPVKAKNLPPEKELAQLENDPYLEKLLDLMDDGENLSPKQQQDLDKMLDRIDELMNQLGYNQDEDDDLDDDFAAKEDIVSLLKKH
ncbi:Der GTPase-activating protein YihI [Orbus sasakiae]|uniref:Der GTPase-activating protein YihI n=1 Tax=Orbus sasakiae TaxID=1078475 RepID=A0ABP9N171_9GAMM